MDDALLQQLRHAVTCPIQSYWRKWRWKMPHWREDEVAQLLGIAQYGCPRCGWKAAAQHQLDDQLNNVNEWEPAVPTDDQTIGNTVSYQWPPLHNTPGVSATFSVPPKSAAKPPRDRLAELGQMMYEYVSTTPPMWSLDDIIYEAEKLMREVESE